MYILYADKSRLAVRAKPAHPLTSGSVNVWPVKFEFSPNWDGLERTAVFRAVKGEPKSLLLGDDGACEIPWEVLTTSGLHVYAGVYGKRGEATVLPTVWADLGVIAQGAEPGSGAKPPTPDLWEQELARKGDALDYDGLNLSLKSGDKTLSQVQIAGGGGGGIAYKFGHGLKQDGLNVSVDAVSDFSGDNTLPMTAVGVQATVGNIEALLATI